MMMKSPLAGPTWTSNSACSYFCVASRVKALGTWRCWQNRIFLGLARCQVLLIEDHLSTSFKTKFAHKLCEMLEQ